MTSDPLLIASLHGLLLDGSESIVPAIQQSVQGYLSRFLAIRIPSTLVAREDVAALAAAGFATPWAIAEALLSVVLAQVPVQAERQRPPRDVAEGERLLVSRARAIKPASRTLTREDFDFAQSAARIQQAGGGSRGLAELVGKRPHPLLVADQGRDGVNLVRRLWFEIYLGSYHFAQLMGERPRFYRAGGLMESETLALPRGDVERLHGRFRRRFALLTPLPRPLALLALRRQQAEGLWELLLTAEDLVGEEARLARLGERASLAPPHPYLLLEAAAQLDAGGQRPARCLLATPDEVAAAQAAATHGARRFQIWGVAPPLTDRAGYIAALAAAGAERTFERVDGAVRVLLEEGSLDVPHHPEDAP